MELLFREEAYRIVGAAMEVYNEKGCGFLEGVYQECAVAALVDEHCAQLLNYLNATGKRLGLLINFGHYPGLEWERIVN